MNRSPHARAAAALLAALVLMLPACERTEPPLALNDVGSNEPDAGRPAPDSDDEADSGTAATGAVFVAPDAPQAIGIAAADVARYLTEMGVATEVRETSEAPACDPGAVTVAFVGDALAGRAVAIEHPQAYGVFDTRCGAGRLVELSGGGLLGRQYAAYALLHELGVRFFHPEEEFVPAAPRWPAEPLAIERKPDFEYRSVSLHLTHPLELGDPVRHGVEAYAAEVERYITWQLKNYASFGLTGTAALPELADYGVMRGLPRSTGFALHNQQQGGGGIIDPDSPLTDEEQIATAIDARMGDDPERYPEQFHFTFNPSEFTEIDDETAVRQLTFIADYMAEKYPDTIVMTINHGTHGEPTENYGVRFYDLPQFAPPNLGVKVHTLMFYDLERPAPVYGNENFHYLFDFMADQYQTRRLWYFPEAAWWLTFDIPVPLYLPITIEARDRDLQKIRFMLDGKLDGHRVFGSGHEWGYWQNEYCSLRMSADLDYRWTDCVADIASVAGPELSSEVASLVEELVELQGEHWFDPEVIRWLVGTDAETELAAQLGIEFHPLPPPPDEILGWTAQQTATWTDVTAPRLQGIVDAYAPLVQRLRAAQDAANEAAVPWLDEIADGAEVNMLRARHAIEVYGALVAMRRHRLGLGEGLDLEAAALLEAADDTTAAVARITRGRSDDYRYKPRTRAIGGGEDGTEDENWTGYTYRYLNRAHHVFYYRRIDELAREAIEGVGAVFSVPNVVLDGPEELLVSVLDDGLSDLSVSLGDGTVSTARLVTHAYAAPGLYDVSMEGVLEGAPWSAQFQVASVETRVFTGRTGVLVEPQTDLAEQIEAVMPALSLGSLGDGRFVIGVPAADEPLVAVGAFSIVTEVATPTGFETAPADLQIPLAVGEGVATLGVRGAVVQRADDAAPVILSGDLETQTVIDAMVALSGGAFDPDSARAFVAEALGFTADTLPETVPFAVSYTVP